MSTTLLALIVAASSGTFIYTKLARSSGQGNEKGAAIGAAASGLVIFIIVFTLLKTFGL